MSNPTETATYRIEKVTDFQSVPVDRLADCLTEFKVWLSMRIACGVVLQGIKHEMPDAFVWIDDGKGECVQVIQSGDVELHRNTVLVAGVTDV